MKNDINVNDDIFEAMKSDTLTGYNAHSGYPNYCDDKSLEAMKVQALRNLNESLSNIAFHLENISLNLNKL